MEQLTFSVCVHFLVPKVGVSRISTNSAKMPESAE
jgi:hypothetical protein